MVFSLNAAALACSSLLVKDLLCLDANNDADRHVHVQQLGLTNRLQCSESNADM